MSARRKASVHLAPIEQLQMAPSAETHRNVSPRMATLDTSRIMGGPPSLVFAGFEGGASMSQKNLEQARSKFLLDKLTGKLPER